MSKLYVLIFVTILQTIYYVDENTGKVMEEYHFCNTFTESSEEKDTETNEESGNMYDQEPRCYND